MPGLQIIERLILETGYMALAQTVKTLYIKRFKNLVLRHP